MEVPYHGMICCFVILTVISAVLCSNALWYPKMIPIRTGGHHHRHTTHIVTHPVTHTRVLVLGDDDHRQNHLPNHELRHRHFRKETSSHRQEYRHTSARSRKIANDALHKMNPNYKYYVPYKRGRGHDEGQGHSYHPPQYQKLPFTSFEEPPLYSHPIAESPWKPVLQYPKGYLPLKQLGIDEARVAEVVEDAMAEIERNEKKQIPLSSIGTRSYHKKEPAKTRPFRRGAVLYDDFAIVVKPYNTEPRQGNKIPYDIDTRPRDRSPYSPLPRPKDRNVFGSRGHEGWKQDLKNTRSNQHCDCENPEA